jgi:hypothetical protein
MEDHGSDRKIFLKRIVKKLNGRPRIGFTWLWITFSGGLL